MLIQWTEKYATGVDEIDDQHKEIFNQLNRLHDAITSGLGKEVIEDILVFAHEYAASHFAFEESCMERYQCPVAKKNKEAHKQFIDSIKEIQHHVAQDHSDTDSVLELYRDLKDWIQNHILKIDTHIRSCAQSHREVGSVE